MPGDDVIAADNDNSDDNDDDNEEKDNNINPLNAELNPILHLLALVGACHIVHVSRIRV